MARNQPHPAARLCLALYILCKRSLFQHGGRQRWLLLACRRLAGDWREGLRPWGKRGIFGWWHRMELHRPCRAAGPGSGWKAGGLFFCLAVTFSAGHCRGLGGRGLRLALYQGLPWAYAQAARQRGTGNQRTVV